jgi:hypothetical protein
MEFTFKTIDKYISEEEEICKIIDEINNKEKELNDIRMQSGFNLKDDDEFKKSLQTMVGRCYKHNNKFKSGLAYIDYLLIDKIDYEDDYVSIKSRSISHKIDRYGEIEYITHNPYQETLFNYNDFLLGNAFENYTEISKDEYITSLNSYCQYITEIVLGKEYKTSISLKCDDDNGLSYEPESISSSDTMINDSNDNDSCFESDL